MRKRRETKIASLLLSLFRINFHIEQFYQHKIMSFFFVNVFCMMIIVIISYLIHHIFPNEKRKIYLRYQMYTINKINENRLQSEQVSINKCIFYICT